MGEAAGWDLSGVNEIALSPTGSRSTMGCWGEHWTDKYAWKANKNMNNITYSSFNVKYGMWYLEQRICAKEGSIKMIGGFSDRWGTTAIYDVNGTKNVKLSMPLNGDYIFPDTDYKLTIADDAIDSIIQFEKFEILRCFDKALCEPKKICKLYCDEYKKKDDADCYLCECVKKEKDSSISMNLFFVLVLSALLF